MTEDTRRALEIVAPLAKHLGIEISADNNFLYCNGQAIGIGCNSTWATVMEFLGYVFMTAYKKDRLDRYGEKFPERIEKSVKAYWFTREQLEKFKEATRNKED